MRFITFQAVPRSARSGRFLPTLIRLALLAAAAITLLMVVLIGLFVVLPVMLFGGLASYFYLRHRIRRTRRHVQDDVIDAEYTIINRR